MKINEKIKELVNLFSGKFIKRVSTNEIVFIPSSCQYVKEVFWIFK
jgi:hypothetical protein